MPPKTTLEIVQITAIVSAWFKLRDYWQTEEERERTRARYASAWQRIDSSGVLDLPMPVIEWFFEFKAKIGRLAYKNIDFFVNPLSVDKAQIRTWFVSRAEHRRAEQNGRRVCHRPRPRATSVLHRHGNRGPRKRTRRIQPHPTLTAPHQPMAARRRSPVLGPAAVRGPACCIR